MANHTQWITASDPEVGDVYSHVEMLESQYFDSTDDDDDARADYGFGFGTCIVRRIGCYADGVWNCLVEFPDIPARGSQPACA